MPGSRILRALVALFAAAIAAGWWLTRPLTIAPAELPDHEPDPMAGERIFWAGGCASCHASPVDGKRARGDDKLLLGGGMELDTAFGIFRVPNISSHPEDGIGAWALIDFVNAMQRGVSPDGLHYYPSFPYTSYARMSAADVMDLKAFLDSLPPIEGRVASHSLGFPWSVRRGVGAWKLKYLDAAPIVPAGSSELVERGRQLVEGAGHCGECHTPRDRFGGLVHDRWLGGAQNPEGEGRVPNITPGGKNISGWSAADIAYYLESGFTPEFDTVGGSMVAVQENLSKLGGEDRDAIAAYLKALPALD
jgi:mono/diheme cytochrome c family protein